MDARSYRAVMTCLCPQTTRTDDRPYHVVTIDHVGQEEKQRSGTSRWGTTGRQIGKTSWTLRRAAAAGIGGAVGLVLAYQRQYLRENAEERTRARALTERFESAAV
jgi:hypothetical protein